MFKKPKLPPYLSNPPLRGMSDRNTLGEALLPKTQDELKQEWRDRFLAEHPQMTVEDLLRLEAQGLSILTKWKNLPPVMSSIERARE